VVAPGKDPLRLAIHVIVYVALFYATAFLMTGPLVWLAGYFTGGIAVNLIGAVFANWLSLRIYENRHVVDVGLWANRRSAENLGLGLAGGAATAVLVLLPPVLAGVAHFTPTPKDLPGVGTILFVSIMLVAGAIAEELLLRGYAFQDLLASIGPWATIVPVGVLFGLLHRFNPDADWFSTANTAGFGILFGYAYLRSRDLWLPIGLHFGWNFTLTLFGAKVSGLTIKVTGYEMSWTAGSLWSGGGYGPEASVLTSVVLIALFYYISKAPIRRQVSPLTDPPAGSEVCEATPSSPS